MSVIVDSSGNPIFSGTGVITPASTARSVLTQSDFEYLGHFAVADSGLDGNLQRIQDSRGAMAGRRVGGQVRLFLTGCATWSPGTPWASPIYEYSIPNEATWSMDYTSIPLMTCVKDWSAGNEGPVAPLYPNGQPISSADWQTVKGLTWDEDLNGLWYGYIANYNVGPDHDPSIGFIQLNDGAGTAQGYGPWRHRWPMPLTGGYQFVIPPEWRYLYGGRKFMFGAETATRGAMGFSLHPTEFLTDWATRPVDQVAYTTLVTNGPSGSHPRYSLVGDPCILHGPSLSSTVYQRVINFADCGWVIAGDDPYPRLSPASVNNPASPASPTVPGGTGDLTPIDSMCAATFIDTGTKYGVMVFGVAVWPSDDYPAPHTWYGPSGNAGLGPDVTGCGHGQISPTGSSGTGYYAAAIAPIWYVFDPMTLKAGYDETIPRHQVPPASFFDSRAMHGPANEDRFKAPTRWYLTGAWFDVVDNRLYAAEWSGGLGGTPIIHCWQVG